MVRKEGRKTEKKKQKMCMCFHTPRTASKEITTKHLVLSTAFTTACSELCHTFVEREVAVARKNISRSAPEVPPMEAEMESASLSHNTALSAAHAVYSIMWERVVFVSEG